MGEMLGGEMRPGNPSIAVYEAPAFGPRKTGAPALPVWWHWLHVSATGPCTFSTKNFFASLPPPAESSLDEPHAKANDTAPASTAAPRNLSVVRKRAMSVSSGVLGACVPRDDDFVVARARGKVLDRLVDESVDRCDDVRRKTEPRMTGRRFGCALLVRLLEVAFRGHERLEASAFVELAYDDLLDERELLVLLERLARRGAEVGVALA